MSQQCHGLKAGSRPRAQQRIVHRVGEIKMAAQFVTQINSAKIGDAIGCWKHGVHRKIKHRCEFANQ